MHPRCTSPYFINYRRLAATGMSESNADPKPSEARETGQSEHSGAETAQSALRNPQNTENLPNDDDSQFAIPPSVRVTEAVQLQPDENPSSDAPAVSSIPAVSPGLAQQFTTPLKSLPPLKDIEPITTPRSFDVAKDLEDPESSPVVTRAENAGDDDENLINTSFADDTFAQTQPHHSFEHSSDKLQVIASYLDVPISELSGISTSLVNALESKSADHEALRSQLSLLQVNQEQAAQLQNKKVETLQKRLRTLDAKYQQVITDNETKDEERVSESRQLTVLRQERDSLLQKLDHLELQISQQQTQHASTVSLKDQEIIRLNESLSRLTQANIDDSQKLNQITRELSDTRNEKFTIQLELSKSTNELNYLRDQKEWFESELKKVQLRYTESLKKAESDYLRLTGNVDALTTQKALLEKMNTSYKETLANLQAELESQTSKLLSLDSKFEVEKIKYAKDLKNKEDLNELLRVQTEQRAEHIQQLERYVEEVLSSLTGKVNDLESSLSQKIDKIAELEEKLKRTEEVLDAELHKGTELPKLSQTAELIAGEGISLSSLYVEFNQLKKQLVFEKSQKAKLASQLESFVRELEEKKPVIASYQEQIQFYESSLKDMIGKVEVVRLEKAEADKEIRRLKSTLTDHENSLVSSKKLCRDLGTQLCYYLIHLRIRDNDEEPLSLAERKAIDNILERSGNKEAKYETDTDMLISSRLVEFGSIVELQQKNENLLKVVRELGKKLEAKDQEHNEQLESAAIEEAKEAIITLEGEIDSLHIKLNAVTKERDQLRTIERTNPSGSSSEVRYLNEVCDDLRKRLSQSEKNLREAQESSAQRINELNTRLNEEATQRGELLIKVNTQVHAVEMAEVRYSNLQKLLKNCKEELKQLKSDIAFWKEQASKQEALLIRKANELSDATSELSKNQAIINGLRTEKDMAISLQGSLRDEVASLRSDKSNLSLFVSNLQSLLKEREASNAEISSRLNQAVENYQSLQERLSERDDKITMLTTQAELELKSQYIKLEQVSDLSQKLAEARISLAEKTALVEKLRSQTSNHESSFQNALLQAQVASTNGDADESRFEALRLAEQQVQEFSSIANNAEKALMDATASFEQFKTDHEHKVTELNDMRSQQQKEIERLSNEIQSANEERSKMTSQHMDEVQSLNSKLLEAIVKANSFDTMKQDYETRLLSLRADLETQEARNADLERRLKDTADSKESLEKEISSLRDQVNSLNEELSNAKIALEDHNNELSNTAEQRAVALRNLQESFDDLRSKLSSAEEQNAILLNQLELNADNSKSSPDQADNQDLSSVVRYLRHEKESAEAKVVTLTEQVNTLRLKLEHTNLELEARNSELLRSQKATIELDSTNQEHLKVLEQLEQLNILRESNTTLRNENRIQAKRLSELEQQLNDVSNSLATIQVSLTQDAEKDDEKDQKIRLLEEENARIKANMSQTSTADNSEEVEALKKRFTNLKNEFQNKLLVHRGKTKELEKVVENLRSELKSNKKMLEDEKKSRQEVVDKQPNNEEGEQKLKALRDESEKRIKELELEKVKLEAQLQVLQKSGASNVSVSDEVEKVRGQLEKEKAEVEKSFSEKLKLAEEQIEALKRDSSNSNVEQLLAQEAEKQNKKLEEALQSRKQELEKQFDERLQTEIESRQQNISGGDSSSEELVKKYESQIEELKQDFEKRLTTEIEDIKKKTEKKFEIKVRMLNKKIDKLEGKAGETKGPSPSPGAANTKPEDLTKSPPGHPYTESTLTVHRPQVDRGQDKKNDKGNDKGKKRPFPNKNQPNKKPKE